MQCLLYDYSDKRKITQIIMEPLKISDIVKATKGKLIQGQKKLQVLNISIDSRTLKVGDMFIAIKGKLTNGHTYVPEVLQKGASSIIVEDERVEFEQWKTISIIKVENTTRALGDIARYYRSKFSPKVIAITGSNGKTTTKEMIDQILKTKHNTVTAPASYNNDIGVPLTILQINNETGILVLEMEMNELGGIRRLCDIAQPDIGVITNIGDTHLEFLYTRDNVAQEKSELLEAIHNKGTAILNADDSAIIEMWERYKFKKVVLFGIDKFANIYANKIVNLNEQGTEFLVCNKYKCRLNIPGVFNIYNALAAISVAREMNCPFEEIIPALEAFKPALMRMQKIEMGKITLFNDSFNANPQSVMAALETFDKFECSGKKVVVLGDMLELGHRSNELHQNIGKNIPDSISILITVGKQAKQIAEGAKTFNKKLDGIFVFDRIQEVTDKLVDILANNDKILIKGSRLMKLEEIVNKLREHYKDADKR